MNINEAQKIVLDKFPFDNFMDNEIVTSTNIATTVQKYLKKGDTILDFASGACDKTAVLQLLGYQCSTFDDLNDEWHLKDGNREKILDFAKDIGIDFNLASDGYLPFQKDTFDMVMAHDVLEHLHDSPKDMLNDLVALVKPGGYLFITVPNAVNIKKRINVLMGKTNLPNYSEFYWYPGPWRGHVREYVKNDLSLLSDFLNLDTVELTSCHHMLEVVPEKLRPPYKLITKVFTGWRDSWLFVGKKPQNWEPSKELPESEYAELFGKHNPFYANNND